MLVSALVFTASATNVEKRVKFAPGTSEATLQGSWDPAKAGRGESFDRYILGASKGQTMVVQLKSSGQASLYVWHKDYNNGSLAENSGQDSSCTIKLPGNGDFNVDVGPAGENPQKFSYTLTVSIR
ncbi:hypothetical protein IV102_02215 [bacterium]|nr:hypothetical protein [bacterium]